MDITEHKRGEKLLRESADRLQTFIDSASSSIGIYDDNLDLVGINRTGLQWWPDTTREALIGKHITELVPDVKDSLLYDQLQQVIATGERFVDYQHIPSDQFGELVMEFEAFKMPDGLTIITTDITAKIRTERALRESEERFKAFMLTFPDNYVILDNKLNVLEMKLDSTSSMTQEDFRCRNMRDIVSYIGGFGKYEMYEKVLETGAMLSGEDVVTTESGKRHFAFKAFKAGECIGAISSDISERKRTEETIRQQLKEKEILLKEVHHRIKNNIASSGSMLRLQADSITSSESRNILHDAISRVESMRIIYDKLLHTDDYSEVPVRNYFDDLITAIVNIFPENNTVTLKKDIDDFFLTVKILFPLGAIVNELMTNSMKYGFINKDSGSIDIVLSKKEHIITLSVHDNGNGLPENFDVDT